MEAALAGLAQSRVILWRSCRGDGSDRAARFQDSWLAAPGSELEFSTGGGVSIADRGIRVNDRIRAREVRVIDEEGNQLGVLPPFEALRKARELGLDLVEISPTANPPVCKIMDYGRYLYQQSKKDHEARKHSKRSQIKEVKFRPATAEHDYQVRLQQIIRFLDEGHKVKAMIFHRGREMAHQEVGRAKMGRLLQDVAEHAQVEIGPRMEANILIAMLAPKKSAAKSATLAAKAKESTGGKAGAATEPSQAS